MTDRELLQQALDALEYADTKDGYRSYSIEIDAIKARLAQPEPEPVAWGIANTRPTEMNPLMMVVLDEPELSHLVVPLYTAPPKKEWVSLTDEEYEAMAECYVTNCYFDTLKYSRAIEAKLKEKNAA